MLRRTFLALSIAFTSTAAFAGGETLNYAPGTIAEALAGGKTVFVDYATDWCSTCARQERVINALRQSDPAYENMVFVRVNWDDYGNHSVATSRNIPRRSTLILLKGDEELGRIVAGTSEADIKALMDKGVAAAAS